MDHSALNNLNGSQNYYLQEKKLYSNKYVLYNLINKNKNQCKLICGYRSQSNLYFWGSAEWKRALGNNLRKCKTPSVLT